MLQFRLQQHPPGLVEDQKAGGGCWAGGGSGEDAKGYAGAQKATRKEMIEQKGKLNSLNKSHNYQLLEARRVPLMSELAQAAVGVASLDPPVEGSPLR